MATDLAKMYISRILNIKFMDRNTGEVLDEWDFEKCKDLDLEAEVALRPLDTKASEIINLVEGE
jgi:hypothetical protein